MIKRCQTFFTVLLGISLFAWGIWILPFSTKEIAHFKGVIAEKKSEKPLFSNTEQKRQGIVKELFINTPEGRMHHRIQSDRSTLMLVPKNLHVNVIERMENITCWMQEKFYPTNEQQVRKVSAKEGLYHYSTEHFIAESVDLSLYRLPGQLLPTAPPETSPLIKGHARDITLTIAGNTPQFKANQFQAELSQGKTR